MSGRKEVSSRLSLEEEEFVALLELDQLIEDTDRTKSITEGINRLNNIRNLLGKDSSFLKLVKGDDKKDLWKLCNIIIDSAKGKNPDSGNLDLAEEMVNLFKKISKLDNQYQRISDLFDHIAVVRKKIKKGTDRVTPFTPLREEVEITVKKCEDLLRTISIKSTGKKETNGVRIAKNNDEERFDLTFLAGDYSSQVVAALDKYSELSAEDDKILTKIEEEINALSADTTLPERNYKGL